VPKAFMLRYENPLSVDEIKQQLSRLLLTNEIPVQYEWVDSIPRSLSGKLQRLKLRKQ